MKTLFSFTARVILGMVLLLSLTTTALAQKLTGVKKIADHTSEITVSSTGAGSTISFTGHTNQFTGVLTGTLNGSTVQFYCIDLYNPVNPSARPVYWDEGSTPPKLTYILNNYFPAKTSYAGKLSDNQEAAAVQLAIWNFSDNLDVTSVSDATIKNRALAIIADANANAGNLNPLQTLQIIPSTQSVNQGGTATFKVKALKLDGTPASVTVTLTKSGGTLSTTSVTTSATTGESSDITLTNGTNVGSITVTATAVVSIPQGTIYVAKVDPTKHQRIVLSSPTTDTKQVETIIEFTACKSKIGNFVWHDLNTNGIQNSGEPGIAGVIVELLQNNTVIAKDTTDANGAYLFSNLANGTYTVRIASSNFATGGKFYNTASTKWYYTKKDQGSDDTKDSDADANTNPSVTLSCGDNLTADFGFFKTCVTLTKTADKTTAKPGEYITYTFILENCGDVVLHGGVDVKDPLVKLDTNFVQQPRTSSTFSRKYLVKTTNCDQIVNTATAEGHPVLDYGTSSAKNLDNVTTSSSVTVAINCKASLGDKVWLDTNKNGIQDNDEVGKQGVTVKLFTCANVLVGTTTTDANGLYKFENLAPGSYYVQFTLPANYVFTTANVGSNDAIDSDVNVSTGKTDCTTLDAGENDMTWDAGIYEQVGSIGDKVWEDTNQNGIQDNGELGIAGVTVKLYNCNGTTPIATTTTDGNGNYLFSSLAAGSYYVEFVKPAGYLPTGKDAGSNDAVDSDADVTTGKTICITLAAGQNDLTWDAGFYKEVDKADLKIEKTASKTTANCGDVFNYSIKVTNLGPKTASSVVVNDVLPAGLIYQSSSASVGSYNNSTGIWTVGNLANGAVATLTITVKVDCGSSNSTLDLGPASDFNLFVIEDLTQPSSDTQGKVAVGRNAILTGYSVGDQLPANSGDVLIVGNNLSFTNGDVFGGNVVYGNATNLPTYSVTIAGTLSQGMPIDFAVAKATLEGLSVSLSNYTVNGTTTFEWGGLKLKGTNPQLNVFKVNGSDLSNANDVQIDVPNGSIALININGTNVSWSGGLEVYGTAITNVLFNFYQATNITLANIDVRGSILAPFAALNYNSGVVNGQVIVKSMTGNGQFNLSLFLGHIPAGKVITNVATVTSPTQDDVLSNNTASAAVTVNPSNNTTTPVQGEASLPKEFKLAQNYPNPFNPSTMIEFSIPVAGSYSLKVYDVIGQEVATLVDRDLSAGTHRVNFDASKLSSGMYIYRLVGNNVNITKKMLLTK